MAKNTQDSSSEERTSAANYIITFYNEVSQLTGYYAQYFNLLIQLKEKYGGDTSKMEDGEKHVINTAVQNIRYHTQIVYIQFSCVAEKLEIDEKETKMKIKIKDEEKEISLSSLYNIVRNTFVIKVEDLENFVTLLNKILVNNVMKNLLENSQNIVENVFKDPEEKKVD